MKCLEIAATSLWEKSGNCHKKAVTDFCGKLQSEWTRTAQKISVRFACGISAFSSYFSCVEVRVDVKKSGKSTLLGFVQKLQFVRPRAFVLGK